jgi:hypothetical protein
MGLSSEMPLLMRSSSLLHVEASRARIFHSDIKTGGGAMVGGARGIIAEMKLMMNGSMRWAAPDPSTLPLPFSLY